MEPPMLVRNHWLFYHGCGLATVQVRSGGLLHPATGPITTKDAGYDYVNPGWINDGLWIRGCSPNIDHLILQWDPPNSRLGFITRGSILKKLTMFLQGSGKPLYLRVK